MFIKVVCASCKKTIHALERVVGKQGECPVCDTLIHIPVIEPEASHALRVLEDVRRRSE